MAANSKAGATLGAVDSGGLGEGDESVEDLAELLCLMQMNRMRLEAMQTTHAVLVETRDGLVRVRLQPELHSRAASLSSRRGIDRLPTAARRAVVVGRIVPRAGLAWRSTS